MAIFRCGGCLRPQCPADGFVFFTCRGCRRVNVLPDNEWRAEIYNLTDALKKAAAAKAKEKALRISAAGSADQLDAVLNELDQLCSRGDMPESECGKIIAKAKKRGWVLEFLKRNGGLLCYADIQKAAEAEGVPLGLYEFSLVGELVREGLVEEHQNSYCLPGAIEAEWLARALPCRDRPIDRSGLEILKTMPFEHRGMNAEFRKNMTPQRITAPGQFVYYGHYGGQPILWRVLEFQEARMLLISEFCLDRVVFDSHRKNVTWENSEIRHWLNGSFLNAAFTPAERSAVLQTEVITPHVVLGGAEGDMLPVTEHTLDSVWLLSAQETEIYFPNPSDRSPDLTTHAIAVNADAYVNRTVNNHIVNGKGRYRQSNWWLRSVTGQGDRAGRVTGQAPRGRRTTGNIEFTKLSVEWDEDQYICEASGLRPAVWLDRTAAAAVCSCPPEADTLAQPVDVSQIHDPVQRLHFGTYAGSPIVWRVLECDDGTALLISENGVLIKPYHKSRNGWTVDYPTWEGSDLRSWLNGEFIQSAFSGWEQERLCRTMLTTPDNSFWTRGIDWLDKVEGGSPTEDLVWIPSIQEVEHWFPSPEDRTAGITDADKYHFAACWETDWKCFWWLRDPGKYDSCASCVMPNGEIFYEDADFQTMVRPMIRIRLPENQKNPVSL